MIWNKQVIIISAHQEDKKNKIMMPLPAQISQLLEDCKRMIDEDDLSSIANHNNNDNDDNNVFSSTSSDPQQDVISNLGGFTNFMGYRGLRRGDLSSRRNFRRSPVRFGNIDSDKCRIDIFDSTNFQGSPLSAGHSVRKLPQFNEKSIRTHGECCCVVFT